METSYITHKSVSVYVHVLNELQSVPLYASDRPRHSLGSILTAGANHTAVHHHIGHSVPKHERKEKEKGKKKEKKEKTDPSLEYRRPLFVEPLLEEATRVEPKVFVPRRHPLESL